MKIITTKQELTNFLHKENKSIGFVPTMGALHNGHISLIEKSVKENEFTVCSIFVNPTQFNNQSDYDKYPITIDYDRILLEKNGCNVLFLPDVKEMYPDGLTTMDIHFGDLENVMEGVHRPGHFAGVATIVYKLFEIVKPTKAYFGEKDYQQLAVIKELVKKMNMPIQIIPCKTLREFDGLAMSSRNMRLTKLERSQAPLIYKVLKEVKKLYQKLTIEELKQWVIKVFNDNKSFTLEYFEIADPINLQPLKNKQIDARAFIVVYMGEVRLIDNIEL